MRADVVRPRAERPSVAILPTLAALWRIRNMRLTLGIASLFTAWLAVQNVFLPRYLVEVKGLAPATMGWVLGMGGIAAVIGGLTLPALSDRFGRRKVAALGAFAEVAAPLVLLWLPGDPVLLGLTILIGWIVLGIAPLYCAVIPAESVPPALAAGAIGLSMGTAELLGGVLAPYAAGLAADAWGLAAMLWLCAGCAIATGFVCLRLEETAPGRG